MQGCTAQRSQAGMLALLLALSVAAVAAPDYPPVEAGVEFSAVLALPVDDKPITLRYGEHAAQFVELSLPGDLSRPPPVVAFVHGGCWLNQFDIGHSRALAAALNQAGYAVWNIEYRRLGDEGGGWPGSLEDILMALALLAVQEQVALDLERVALAGHSAGGHLVLLAAQQAGPGLSPRAVLGLAPITDISHYASGENSCNQAAAQFLDGLSEFQRAAANPALEPAPPGTVLLYGNQDKIVPFEVPFLKPERLATLPAGHFDWLYPGTPAFTRFLAELKEALL